MVDELFNMTLPSDIRNKDDNYAIRLTFEGNSTVEPGIAIEAIGISDATEEMTEEHVDQAQAFTDKAAVLRISEASAALK